MSEVTSIERTKNGMKVREDHYPEGKITHSLVVPKKAKESFLDLSYLNLESLLNKAQMDSYFQLLQREKGISFKKSFETDFYSLTVSSKMSFNNNDLPPLSEIPSDSIVKKVDRIKFLEHAEIPSTVKRAMFGDPYFMMNVRSGAFNFAETLVMQDENTEPGVTREDELLAIMLDLQEKQEDIQDELAEVNAEVKELLTPIATSITSKQLTNTSVYFYTEDINDKTSSRISMSKQRRFSYKEAGEWVYRSNIDPDEVMSEMCDSYALRRNHPEIHERASSEVFSYIVEDLEAEDADVEEPKEEYKSRY